MSETATEKETEFVSGIIEGITQKGMDKWQVAVKPDGSQYSKNLWTKDSALVSALADKIGSHGGFVCGISHWQTNDGKNVRSLWINESADDGPVDDLHIKPAGGVATPAAAPQGRHVTAASEGMTPEKWDAKERRDYRSRAWAQTLAAFTHTIKVDEDPADVFLRLQPFHRKIYEDVTQSFAYDDSDVPFD